MWNPSNAFPNPLADPYSGLLSDPLLRAAAAQNASVQDEQDRKQKTLLAQAFDSSEGDNLMKAMQNANTPKAPQLQFGVNSRGWGEGLMQGLGNAVSNTMSLRDYGRQKEQQQSYFDLARASDLAANQKELNKELKEKENIRLGNQALAILQNPASTPEQRLQANKDLNTASNGKFVQGLGSTYATNEANNQNIGPKSEAETQAKLAEYDTLMKKIHEIGPMEIDGVPQLNAINAYNALLKQMPMTTMDVTKGELANKTADVELQDKINKLEVQPQVLQDEQAKRKLEIENMQYDNDIRAVEAKFIEDEKKYKVQDDKQKLIDLQKGRDLFKNLQKTGALKTKDLTEQAEIQASLGRYNVKWIPPGSPYKAYGSGENLLWMDTRTGKIGKPDNKGVVKEWKEVSSTP